MVLRVTARLAQRLGTITPSQQSATANRAFLAADPEGGTAFDPEFVAASKDASAVAESAEKRAKEGKATRCRAKCGVLDTV